MSIIMIQNKKLRKNTLSSEAKAYMRNHNKCSCGNVKWKWAKRCTECHHNKRGQGSVTRACIRKSR